MNKHYSMKAFLNGLTLGIMMLIINPLQAQTSYIGPAGGDWFTDSNWSSGLPAPGNDASIFGSGDVVINANLTADFNITSYGKITTSAAVNIQGVFKNHSSLGFTIVGSGALNNLGTIDNQGPISIPATGSFTNSEVAVYSSTADGSINNAGTVTISGGFTNVGTITNDGTAYISGSFSNQNTIQNNGTFEVQNGTFMNAFVQVINNAAGATFEIKAPVNFDQQGYLTNDGTLTNFGNILITGAGRITNNNLFNNNNGGYISNGFEVINNATFNNNNNATFFNDNVWDNSGTISNNGLVENGAYINNLVTGVFTNTVNGVFDNQEGSELRNDGTFTNLGTIDSEGDLIIKVGGTLTNENLLFSQTNGTIQNHGAFHNNNTIQNFDIVVNHPGGNFQNTGVITIENGQVTNNGDFHNIGRLTNELELVNNANLYNPGTIENGVRIFNNGYFENTGYLLNIGDFDNNPTGNFTNSGAIDNNDGGIITNYGEFNNDNEIFNNFCSSFVNESSGIINNTSWITNKSLFWNFGVINGNQVMNMFGGVVITGSTSTEVCESVTANLDGNGETLILGTSISVSQFDTCGTLSFYVDDLDEITFTCADKGPNLVTLKIEDRKGNSVECTATVTIIDDMSPIIENCPTEVVVVTTENEAPASWTPPTATDNCDIPTLTSTHNPGDIFQLGTTIVTYTATDTENNSAICDFPVTVVQDGDCADILTVRKVASTNDNCGTWCNGTYAFTLGPNQCYDATDNLLFIEYRDGTALLTGDVTNGAETVSVYVEFTGYSATPPANSPKFGLCVTSGASDWTYYQDFTGWVTFEDCTVMDISRFGPSFQIGTGANLQEPNAFGGAAWFEYGGQHEGDFNFRLSAPIECQRSIYLEAECADHIGSRWTVGSDANASNGEFLLPPGGTAYSTPPVNSDDLVTFNFGVTEAGEYRIYARSLAANGSSDSYWVRVNGGNWVKFNKVNAPNQGSSYQWDQVSQWHGCNGNMPLTFHLNPGTNTIDFSWREPNIRLDKLFVTLVGKKPTGMGDPANNCDGGGDPPVEPCNTEVLFVVGNTNLNSGDQAIKDRLINSGYNLTIVDDWDSQTSDANGKGVVIISSTIQSGEVNTKFRDVAVPVIVWEGWLFDDMKMTGTVSGSDFGTHVDDDLDIAAPNHPIASGLTGEIDIYTSDDEINFGMPTSGATIIAHIDDDPIWAALFTYEEGANMKNMTAPARRAGFFLRDNGASRMTDDGWTLFDATVVWAIGECDQNVDPPAPCNKTALFVTGSVNPHSGDLAVKARLESLGYAVTMVEDDVCKTSDANGMGLVYVSSSVSSSKVGSKYRDISIPVVSSEAWIYDDMKMTGTGSGTNYGEFAYTSTMTISDPSHPIVQGITGNIQVMSGSKKVAWGNPTNGASRIGHVPGEPGCAMLFTYEKGANMVGMNAPERRAGIWLRNSSTMNSLNSTGWAIFDKTIEWASGCSSSQNLDAEFNEILDLDAFRNEREVQLIWKNNTAFKNTFMTLEHSTDGLNYEPISEFDAYIEENKSMRVYQEVDLQPEIGQNFYRVTVEFLDGTSAHSEVQIIEFEEMGDFTLFPNPAGNYTKVNLENMQGQSVSIQIFDLVGHQLQQVEIDEVDGLDVRLDLSELRDGQYLVSVFSENRRPVTKKLYVSK